MTDREMVQRAIAAHASWKHRLREAIATGASQWDPTEVWPDFLCEFGRWLHDMPEFERSQPQWRKVHDLHAQFHDLASKVLALAIEGDRRGAEQAFAMGSPFIRTSAQLTLALVAWKMPEDRLGRRLSPLCPPR